MSVDCWLPNLWPSKPWKTYKVTSSQVSCKFPNILLYCHILVNSLPVSVLVMVIWLFYFTESLIILVLMIVIRKLNKSLCRGNTFCRHLFASLLEDGVTSLTDSYCWSRSWQCLFTEWCSLGKRSCLSHWIFSTSIGIDEWKASLTEWQPGTQDCWLERVLSC